MPVCSSLYFFDLPNFLAKCTHLVLVPLRCFADLPRASSSSLVSRAFYPIDYLHLIFSFAGFFRWVLTSPWRCQNWYGSAFSPFLLAILFVIFRQNIFYFFSSIVSRFRRDIPMILSLTASFSRLLLFSSGSFAWTWLMALVDGLRPSLAKLSFFPSIF